MSFKLKEKENAFQVTREGAFEYHTFEHGETYDKVPDQDRDKFDELKAESSKLKAESKKN